MFFLIHFSNAMAFFSDDHISDRLSFWISSGFEQGI